MDRLDAQARHALPERSFAYIDSQGGEHLPIHDAAHVRNATTTRWLPHRAETRALIFSTHETASRDGGRAWRDQTWTPISGNHGACGRSHWW